MFPNSDGLTYFTRLNQTWDATLTAVAKDGKANIIQRPRILTSHAVPASFFVGSTVPFISGSYFGVTGSGSSSYYDRQDVGIGLEVTPFITPDKLVVMEIMQTIEELVGSPPTNANDPPPSTAKREATSQLSVRSGDAVLLGGFMRNESRAGHSGVPFLKDIPVLGYLFKSHNSSKSRSELMVLIKPTVLSSPEEAAKLADAQRVDSPAIRECGRNVGRSFRGWLRAGCRGGICDATRRGARVTVKHRCENELRTLRPHRRRSPDLPQGSL